MERIFNTAFSSSGLNALALYRQVAILVVLPGLMLFAVAGIAADAGAKTSVSATAVAVISCSPGTRENWSRSHCRIEETTA